MLFCFTDEKVKHRACFGVQIMFTEHLSVPGIGLEAEIMAVSDIIGLIRKQVLNKKASK